MTKQSDERCAFEVCPRPTREGFEYCLQHLKYLTEVNVEKIILEITLEELGVEAHEVTRTARFIDDLGADSMDTVELAMALETAFDIEIDRNEVEKIQTVGAAVSYVTNQLLSETAPRFLIDHNVNVEAIHQNMEQNPENVVRLLEQIIHSALFQDYISRLGLETEETAKVFGHVVANNWVDHVTTVPDFDEGKVLSRVSVVILCRKEIYYFTLRVKSIAFTFFPLTELRLSYQIKYSDHNDVSEIEVSAYSHNLRGVDETFTFMTPEGVEGALTFLDKYLHNMEALK